MSIENTTGNYFQNMTPEEKYDEIIGFLGDIAYGELDGNLPLYIRYLPIEDAYIKAKNEQRFFDMTPEEREAILEEIMDNEDEDEDEDEYEEDENGYDETRVTAPAA